MEPAFAIGLMSGTSLDGIDAAIVKTNGETISEIGAWLTEPYEPAFQAKLHEAIKTQTVSPELEKEFTLRHAAAVKALLEKASLKPADIKIVGFHGQTIMHNPAQKKTWAMGDGALLAKETGIDVVCNFRENDVKKGGQGAPLVPLFHAALANDLPHPLAILNIGGISNVTWINGEQILAFDCGPGNALINDAMHAHTGKSFDEDGSFGATGKINVKTLSQWQQDVYFAKDPPKSLDRGHFAYCMNFEGSPEDHVATLTEFTASAIEDGTLYFNGRPEVWYVCGGGRHNAALMKVLKRKLGDVRSVDELGWQGDALEAQAFAYLAVRSIRKLPLSLPTTTGVTRAVTGGVFYPA